MLEKIFRVSHDCFRIQGEVMVYTDPFHVETGLPKADVILISHEHYDHCSPEDIEKLVKKDTITVAPKSCKDKLSMAQEVKLMKPGDKANVKGIPMEAVFAYNVNKPFHPKEAGYLGYVFSMCEKSIYFAGDTDRIPEMKNIRCDIALLPVSGTYVMTAEEAVQAALDLCPGVVIPMHYGDIVGTKDDALRFQKMYKGKTEIK